MPWVEVEERHEEVQADGAEGADYQVCEGVVTEFKSTGFELLDHDPDGGEGRVGHDDPVDHHAAKEHLLGALRSVAHAQNKVHGNYKNKGVAEDSEYVFAQIHFGTGRINCLVRKRTSDEEEDQVEVSEREKREEKLHELVDKFDVEQYFSRYGVRCLPDLLEVEQRVDGCKEGSV